MFANNYKTRLRLKLTATAGFMRRISITKISKNIGAISGGCEKLMLCIDSCQSEAGDFSGYFLARIASPSEMKTIVPRS